MNLSFDLSVALGQLQRGEHRSFIAAERLSEAGEQCGLCRMQPCRPSARVAFPDHARELASNIAAR
jgi:hypothetical protein